MHASVHHLNNITNHHDLHYLIAVYFTMYSKDATILYTHALYCISLSSMFKL